jgi:hypothetical protein
VRAFYVAPTSHIPNTAKSISLAQVERICGSSIAHTALKAAVDRVLAL